MLDQAGGPACGTGFGDSMAFPRGRDSSLSDGFSSLVRCQGCHQAISAGLTCRIGIAVNKRAYGSSGLLRRRLMPAISLTKRRRVGWSRSNNSCNDQ